MSNYLAIATVTETLRQQITQAVSIVPGARVVSERPGELPAQPTVRVYLYQVTPNATFRSDDLPTRRRNGDLIKRPQVALDLHYLLSFYGDDSVHEPQRMLGRTASLLHSRPILTRDIIQDAVNEAVMPPLSLTFLSNSDLVDQVVSVKFTPLALSLDELSKLWSVFFQTQYVLSVAYQATVVLIESTVTPATALPVQERTVNVFPFRSPVIERLDTDRLAPGATMTIRGRNLDGDDTQVRVDDALVSPAAVSADTLEVALPGNLRSGIHGVQVVHRIHIGSPPSPHAGAESNALPFMLEPEITSPSPLSVAQGGTLTLSVTPPVGRHQRVALLVGEREIVIPSRPDSDPETATSFSFDLPAAIAPGSYLLRLRVDGAMSRLQYDEVAHAYTAPEVTVT